MVRASKIIKLYISLLLTFTIAGISYAQGDLVSGIEAYKSGNYENSVEIMKSVVKDDPTCVVGYYYLGLAYAKQGKNILAIQNYNRVINLNSDSTLTQLARQGKNNIGEKQATVIESQLEDIEEDYNPIFNDSAINVDDKKKKTNTAENKTTQVIKASDYAKKETTSKHEFDPNREPTNDEIVNSIKILQKAGLLQNGAAGLTGGTAQNNVPNAQNIPIDSRAQQMQSMLMMMNGGNNGNMNMMQMMPYMNNGGKVDPQMMQMMLMNQMMPNFSTGGNGTNGY